MGVGDIIGDAIAYPFSNIKALVLYAVLGIIAGFIGGASILSIIGALSSKGLAGFAFGGLSIVGIILFLIVVTIVYYIVPAIIIIVLGLFLRDWILTIISIILVIVFALANFMAKCRLAKTDSLGDALAIGEAIGDISRVGLGKIIATVIVIALILIIVAIILGLISKWNATIGSILLGIFAVYFVFFYNRAIGLLYSEAE